ncbi:hypothetical protein, partial [Streptomyces aureus]|uniref:hypothetical protein n=1 Tax=Streptomyces aureus TaxID=193461 RepID=UPI001C1F8511
MTKILADSGAELSQEELLDALWLAGKLPRASGSSAARGSFPASHRASRSSSWDSSAPLFARIFVTRSITGSH